jgi:hypothetical protein
MTVRIKWLRIHWVLFPLSRISFTTPVSTSQVCLWVHGSITVQQRILGDFLVGP